MSKKQLPLKTAVVCMVYNGYEYLSEFLSHYDILCDHLYMIDHNSQIDLRHLKAENITVVRTNHEAQFQSEATNTVIETFGLKQKYDWIFVVDIDEFLPFTTREAFHTFLTKHNKTPVIQFHWSNGVPFYDESLGIPTSLIDCQSIRFFHKKSVHFKTFVNTKRTKGRFYVPTGAHHISYILPWWRRFIPFLQKYKNYKPFITDLPLLHIVAFNKTAFLKKIKNYVEQMKYREHIKGQGGWVVRDYPTELSGDEWLWYIANFRVSNPDQFFEMKTEYFLENPVFAHLSPAKVTTLREKILSGPKTEKKPASESEKEYLEYKKDDRDVMGNIQWFKITPDNELITRIPVQ